MNRSSCQLPPPELQAAVRAALYRHGARHVGQWLGVADVTALRIGAGVPMLPSVLARAAARIAEHPEPPSPLWKGKAKPSAELEAYARDAIMRPGLDEAAALLGIHPVTVLRVAAGVPIESAILARLEERLRAEATLTPKENTSA